MNTYYIAAENQGLFQALGLNWKSFILNGVAFLFVVLILKKYVYPSLIKAIDARADNLNSADMLKAEAQAALDKASKGAIKILADAREASDDILDSTKKEADQLLEESRAKAQHQADRIIAESREQLAQDVQTARMTLRHEMAKLVTRATETVIDEKLDKAADQALIERSLVGKK